jgi:transposase
VLRRISRRREVSSIALLTAPLDGQPARLFARHFARHFEGTIDGTRLLETLRYFRRVVGRPLLLVWDRLNTHTSRRPQTWIAERAADCAAEFLPGYAPELNPEEQCNRDVKHATLNALPADVGAMRAQVRREFQRLGRQPATLANFFAHAGLHVT